jgi:hypothetical protein
MDVARWGDTRSPWSMSTSDPVQAAESPRWQRVITCARLRVRFEVFLLTWSYNWPARIYFKILLSPVRRIW